MVRTALATSSGSCSSPIISRVTAPALLELLLSIFSALSKEFEKQSARTMCQEFHPDFFPPEVIHGMVGLAAESGELLGAMKKSTFYGSAPDIDNIKEELGDILFYWVAVTRGLGFDTEEIMDSNIDKLRKRYPEKFTKKHSEIRLDKVRKEIGGLCNGCKHIQKITGKNKCAIRVCGVFSLELLWSHAHNGIIMPWNIKCMHYKV